jgi:hypothetical protein
MVLDRARRGVRMGCGAEALIEDRRLEIARGLARVQGEVFGKQGGTKLDPF